MDLNMFLGFLCEIEKKGRIEDNKKANDLML